MLNPANPDETIALVILLGTSFILGMLIWFLIFHLPRSIRAARELRETKHKLEDIEKKYEEVSAEHKINSAKLENLEQDLSKAQNQVVEQTSKLVASRNESEDLRTQLYKSNKSESIAIEELGESKRICKSLLQTISDWEKTSESTQLSIRMLQNQLDTFRNQVGGLEIEKKNLTDQNLILRNDLEELSISANEYEKDLQTALAENQKLQAQAQEIQSKLEEADTIKAQNERLHDQLNQLTTAVQQLQQAKAQTDSKLAVFTQKEAEVTEAENAENQVFNQHLEAAQNNHTGNPFFEPISESELVENPETLAAFFAQPSPQEPVFTQPFEEEIYKLTEEDIMAGDEAQRLAGQALEMPGFFQTIDATALIQPETDPDDHDDDSVIARMLASLEANLSESALHKEANGDDWVENPELLNHIPTQIPIEEDEPVVKVEAATTQDSADLQKALAYANTALHAEGFYTEIAADKLIDTPAITEENPAISDPKYKTAIERAVVTEIGKLVPFAKPAQQQDLKKISGIGAFIEQKLNHFGIYTYEQISCFDDSFIPKITAAIGFSEDTIYRDRWVEQARALARKN